MGLCASGQGVVNVGSIKESTCSSNKTLAAGKEVEVSLVQNWDSTRSDEATEVLHCLSLLSKDLIDLLPMNECSSVLDVICETQNSVINVEVQIEQQNTWDLRIQHHAYCLFHRQFKQGMDWTSMPSNRELGSTIKRVVAWLTFHVWVTDKIERRFCMLTEDNKTRGGVEFVDINLQALVDSGEDCREAALGAPPDSNVVYWEWMTFLAKADKQPAEYLDKVKTPAVLCAYTLLLRNDLPDQVLIRYKLEEEALDQISYYIMIAAVRADDAAAAAEAAAEAAAAQKRAAKNLLH
eukprot:2910891-Rhodomonas_salina.1